MELRIIRIKGVTKKIFEFFRFMKVLSKLFLKKSRKTTNSYKILLEITADFSTAQYEKFFSWNNCYRTETLKFWILTIQAILDDCHR